MAPEWRNATFAELCDIKRGASPRPIKDWVVPAGIPWIKISDANAASGRYIGETRESIKESGRSKSVTVYPGDLILSNSATPGIPKFLGIEACIHDGWLLLRNFRGLDKNFAYYLLLTQRDALVDQGNGSVFTNLKTEILKNHKVSIPPMREQQRISHFLSSLDDRLENLRSINSTLEAIAQALFKSWFVDFDPVRAKAEGRDPEGMDAATAALFPSEFEDSALGPIPKGWRAGTVGDVSDINASKWTARKHPETVKYIDLSGVNRNRIETWADLDFGEAPSRARNHLREGDTIVGTVRPGNRAYAYIHEPETNLTGSTGFAVLSPKKPHLSSFVYLAATSDEAIGRLVNLADGAAYPAVRPGVVGTTPCALPSGKVLEDFARISVPMLEGIAKNSARAATLADLRDNLLPRLISGRLRLPEAEVAVEEL